MPKVLLTIVLVLLTVGRPDPDTDVVQNAIRSGLLVTAGSITSPYRIMSVFIMPGDTVTISVTHGEEVGLTAAGGTVSRSAPSEWRWIAPVNPGCHQIMIGAAGDKSVTMNAFVMVPSTRLSGGYLNGYRIGSYPKKPLKQLTIYHQPKGFIEVTPGNEETLVSPNFRLKQFLCKQDGSYPKYVILREKLLLKLELILEKVQEKGFRARTFAILSGYRTPYYNHMIGNVQYSRHIYGGAADIFIDEEPPYDVMDDLNRDGSCDYRDADVLRNVIEELFGQKWYEPYIGGLGRYASTGAHGPFVHVDVRGFRARW